MLLLTSSAVFASDLTPTTNLDTLKAEIIKYHDSGAESYDIQKIADKAQGYLAMRIAANQALTNPKKLAIVLDIDETSLSNYHDLKTLNFGGTDEMQNVAEGRADDSAIAPTLELYRYAVANGITVFFITGRTESYRASTIKNLNDVGYTIVKNSVNNCENSPVSDTCLLYMRDGQYLNTSAIPYKSAMRHKITAAGYDIVINVGDQYSDLAGGYSDRAFKYPNFMYYIP